LEHEIDLLRTLNHKNIVKYLGTSKDSKNLNIFLEKVTGGSLENIYRKYPIPENILKIYTKQILEGLEYLHAYNIIHRDIKAANILFETNAVCKLADFGSSKKICSSMNKSLCGTPYWMAPEVVRQSGHNRFADIWSLGCTVYELFMRKPPWSDKKDISVLLTIEKAKRPP